MKTSTFEIENEGPGGAPVLVLKGEFVAPNVQHVPVIEQLGVKFSRRVSAIAEVSHDNKGTLRVTVRVRPVEGPDASVQTSAPTGFSRGQTRANQRNAPARKRAKKSGTKEPK